MLIRDTLTGGMLDPGGGGGEGPVRIYLCGITTYDDSHIGHARTVVVFDVLRRHLAGLGTESVLVQNFTDVDDKIIARSEAESSTAAQVSQRYIDRYFEDFDGLNVGRASGYPRATEHMGEIIGFIRRLEGIGAAYAAPNGVYFDVSRAPRYGALSKKRTDELVAGARVEVDESKRNPLDFALWKLSDAPPSWDSPWGRGRPGWHIECSAMCGRVPGGTLDIHGGGRDLIFPHHENEMAQSEACTGEPLARIWMHVGMVTAGGEKMSKSTGNVVGVRGALARWGPNVLRIFCLSGHYSKPVDYTDGAALESLSRWRLAEAGYAEASQAAGEGAAGAAEAAEAGAKFDGALGDDLNTHLALTAFLSLARDACRLAAGGELGAEGGAAAAAQISRMAGVLGLEFAGADARAVRALVDRRREMRAAGRYAEADAARDELAGMGVELVDRGGRTVWIPRERVPGEG
ncbi:Cysteine--tRNA ligase [Nitrosopumilaceae archaeon]|nr:cysteine--tRNA ligase [Nitrosopumilus sp.]CAI9831403.1 Cysteine--tRNA ligase [Nitrosopumilaceae archaeon]MDA7944225.1 cysteine--tRNA ligase [Nitrosopumilus sp.]MDA7953977.1 cysteine--tRNA ligase [Nitrosopumilus sp.]MDA7972905.1 cysteine--tRNA ligase [Nitrosopumilus sp.]